MKKSLLLLLSFAMVFTMFASVAFAADSSTELTAEQKFDALVDAGIMQGTTDADGNTIAGLDQAMTRAQAAEILVNLFQLPKTATKSSYSDVSDSHWALQQIEAVKVAGYMVGNTDGTFNPDSNVTLEELASVICEVLGLDPVDGAEVAGTSWGAGYVAAAVAAGLLPQVASYTNDATRADLVTVTYAAYQEVLKSQQASATFAATGANKLQVTFNRAVDASKAEFAVKRGTTVVNVSKTTFDAGNKVATIETASNMINGDYTITVTGVNADALEGTVKVEASHATKLEITGDVAALTLTSTTPAKVNGATIGYKVYNQYNEDITKVSGTPAITWTPSLGTATSTGTGVVTLVSDFYVKGQAITLTGIVQNTTVVATKTVTFGDPAVTSSITVEALWDSTGDEKTLDTGNIADFYLLITANDQYGNEVNAAKFNKEVVVSANAAIAGVEALAVDGQGPDSDKIGLQLKAPTTPFAGSSVITFIPRNGGATSAFTVTVAEAKTVASVTISNPSATVAAKDTGVEIPFSAIDNYGNEVTSYDALKGVNLTPAGALKFEPDYVNNKAVLKYDAPTTAGIQVLMAVVGSNVSQITVNVQDARVPKVVVATKDLTTSLAVGATATVKAANLVVNDQYGAAYTLNSAFFTDYYLKVEAADGSADKVGITSADSSINLVSDTDSFTLTAAKSGTENIKVSIYKVTGDELLGGSEFQFATKAIAKADIASYEVGDIPTLGAFADHDYDLDIHGILADGSKVTLPAADYGVTTSVYGLTVNNNNLDPSTVSSTDYPADKDYNSVAVIVIGDQTILKDFVLSTKAPVLTSIDVKKVDTTGKTIAVADGLATVNFVPTALNDLLAVFNGVDQYSKAIAISSSLQFVSFSNVKDNDDDKSLSTTNGLNNGTAKISGLEHGDRFTITFVAKGIVQSANFVIK